MKAATRTARQPSPRTARLEARVTGDQKALFQHAADLAGRSLTDFVIGSVQEAASRAIREREVLTLSGLDREVFLDAILHPPAPSKRLRQAAQRYKRLSA
jgi:uncharacterized protein (DUF1778 family)